MCGGARTKRPYCLVKHLIEKGKMPANAKGLDGAPLRAIVVSKIERRAKKMKNGEVNAAEATKPSGKVSKGTQLNACNAFVCTAPGDKSHDFISFLRATYRNTPFSTQVQDRLWHIWAHLKYRSSHNSRTH